MQVKVRQTEDGWVVANRIAWAPGTYSTPEAAARAVWNMRHHGTVDAADLITPATEAQEGR